MHRASQNIETIAQYAVLALILTWVFSSWPQLFRMFPLHIKAVNAQVQVAVKAFPTAEGFGQNSLGGRGGTVIHVTNLNNSGAGSLRAALEASGRRFVVFDVSGTITLTSMIRITNPFLYIAGQTSPGGVQVKGATTIDLIQVGASHVTIRHLRLRNGFNGTPSGEQGAALRIYQPTGSPIITDVIVDHCSLQWSADDTLNLYQQYDRVTVQWCLIAETVTAGISVGSAGTSVLIGGFQGVNPQSNSSLHHNVLAHSTGRNPRLSWLGTFDFVNNVVYNWGSGNPGSGFSGSNNISFDDARGNNQPSLRTNFVKNQWIPGPNSQWTGNSPYLLLGAQVAGTRVFLSGNFTPDFPTGTPDDWSNPWRDADSTVTNPFPLVGIGGGGYKSATRFSAPLITETANASLKALLTGASGVGAFKPSRDSVDTRILGDVNAGTGNIDTIGAGGPWPTLTGGSPPTDTDSDGIPDTWEVSHGLNKDSAADANSTAANGYTNIENYLNELAGDPVPGFTSSPSPTASVSPSPLPCVNPSPISPGFSSPCPVFGISPASGSISQNFTVSLTPDAQKTVWIYKTLYITEGSTWKSITLPGTIQYTYWLQGNISHTFTPASQSLSPGVHYLASWDWTWDATNQCYKGPGATACNGGSYRMQQVTIL